MHKYKTLTIVNVTICTCPVLHCGLEGQEFAYRKGGEMKVTPKQWWVNSLHFNSEMADQLWTLMEKYQEKNSVFPNVLFFP